MLSIDEMTNSPETSGFEKAAKELKRQYRERDFEEVEITAEYGDEKVTLVYKPVDQGKFSKMFERVITLGNEYEKQVKVTAEKGDETVREYIPGVVGVPEHDVAQNLRNITGAWLVTLE